VVDVGFRVGFFFFGCGRLFVVTDWFGLDVRYADEVIFRRGTNGVILLYGT